MAYTLKGKKCGTVRFTPMKSGVVDNESESYSGSVTSNPIEKGSEINDHVNNAAPTFGIKGTLIDGNTSKKALIKMRDGRDIIKYTGKTQMKNLVITSLKFDSTSKNEKGYTFSASFKQVQITAPKKRGKKKKRKEKMSDQDAGKSKKKKLKKTKNKGLMTKASDSVSSASKKKLKKAKKSKSSTAPLTRKTKGYSGAK